MSWMQAMEHRWSSRKAIELDVTVESHDGRIRARTQDVGLEGMYLRVPVHCLEENTPVELIFALGRGRQARTHRVKACVVRRGRNGVGVMFLEFTADAFRYLEDLLYVARPLAGANGGGRWRSAGRSKGPQKVFGAAADPDR